VRDWAWRFIRDRCPGCVWDLALTDFRRRRSQLMHLGNFQKLDHHWPTKVLCGKQDFQKESKLKRSYMCQGLPCQDTMTPERMSVSCAWRKIASFPLTKKAFSARKNSSPCALCQASWCKMLATTICPLSAQRFCAANFSIRLNSTSRLHPRINEDMYIKYLTLPVPDPACSRRALLTTSSRLRRGRVRGER